MLQPTGCFTSSLRRLEAGKSAWWVGLWAWVLAGYVARILSTNMTLMLAAGTVARYVLGFGHGRISAEGRSDAGAALADDDGRRAVYWRLVAGVSGGAQHVFGEEKKFAAGLGGKIAAFFGLVYLVARVLGGAGAAGCGEGRAGHSSALSLVCTLRVMDGWRWSWSRCWWRALRDSRRLRRTGLAWAAALLALLVELTLVIYRDAVRDVSLLAKGFDVWDRAVVTNWGVVGLFLVAICRRAWAWLGG